MKHRITGIIAAAAILLGGTTSCLEKYPGSYIPEAEAMQTFNDAEQHLTGIYISLMSGYLYSGYLTLLPDIQADLAYAVEGNTNTYGDFWQWTIQSTDTEIEGVYGALYSVIGNCNFYLDCIEGVMSRETDDEKLATLDTYTGEVYTIRAMCYLELLKCYCKAYDPATAADELGVVLRTKYFEEEPTVRASLEDSYALVLSDLEMAESLLDNEDDVANSYYMSAAAAQALHARTALYMQDWDTAIEYAGKLISNDAFALSGTATNAQTGYAAFLSLWYFDVGTELIWEIGFTNTSYGGALGQVFLNYNRDYAYFYPDYVPAQWVLNLYGSTDIRYDGYFADENVTGIYVGYDNGLSWPLLVKYYGNRTFTNSYRIYHVSMPKPLRLAEQYLIRAEAYCRLGRYSQAQADLNALSSSRSGGNVSVSADNWLETISQERVKELYMEGFRLHDLKRWGMGFTRTPQSCSQAEGSSLSVSPDNPLFVWPIPQHELQAPGSQIQPNESNR